MPSLLPATAIIRSSNPKCSFFNIKDPLLLSRMCSFTQTPLELLSTLFHLRGLRLIEPLCVPGALQQHQKSMKHLLLTAVNAIGSLFHSNALEQHRFALHSLTAIEPLCVSEALQRHRKSTEHCCCCECDWFFVHSNALEQHRSALRSCTCVDCDRTFVCFGSFTAASEVYEALLLL